MFRSYTLHTTSDMEIYTLLSSLPHQLTLKTDVLTLQPTSAIDVSPAAVSNFRRISGGDIFENTTIDCKEIRERFNEKPGLNTLLLNA